jgi:hypothetical protein
MKRIRKQVYELTPTDLVQFPVWEWCLDEEGIAGQDEATVRPVASPQDANPWPGIVAAEFTFADGGTLTGYLTPFPSSDASPGDVHPVVVTEEGQVAFWLGTLTPEPAWVAECYRILGRSADDVFPVQFRSIAPTTVGVTVGSINGFMQLKSFHDQSVIEHR